MSISIQALGKVFREILMSLIIFFYKWHLTKESASLYSPLDLIICGQKYSETCLYWPQPSEHTCAERPHTPVTRSNISMQFNLWAQTTCLERLLVFLVTNGMVFHSMLQSMKGENLNIVMILKLFTTIQFSDSFGRGWPRYKLMLLVYRVRYWPTGSGPYHFCLLQSYYYTCIHNN